MSRCWLIGSNNLSSSLLHCSHKQMNHLPNKGITFSFAFHLPLWPALTSTVAVLFMYHLCWPHKQTMGRLHHREGSALAETDKLTESKRSRLGCTTQRFHSSNSSHIYHLGQAASQSCDSFLVTRVLTVIHLLEFLLLAYPSKAKLVLFVS